MTDESRCALCGSYSLATIRELDDGVRIVRCGGCSVARTFPYPRFDFKKEEKYSAFYLENERLFRSFAKSMIEIVLGYKRRGKFLDIGCSVGFLLDEAKERGFETDGIELNREAADVARSKSHRVGNRTLEESAFASGSFDVVTFNHVLEHVLDLRPFLAEVRRVLKPDGIAYCGVPNYRGFMQQWLGRKWYGWGMPDHIWHFDGVTFEALIGASGFAPLTVVRNSLYYPYSKSLRKNTRATIARIADRLGFGDMVWGVFAKGAERRAEEKDDGAACEKGVMRP